MKSTHYNLHFTKINILKLKINYTIYKYYYESPLKIFYWIKLGPSPTYNTNRSRIISHNKNTNIS